MFRVSCIQLRSDNNIQNNLNKTLRLIIKAVNQKTDFIITPEVSSHFSLKKKEYVVVPHITIFFIILVIFTVRILGTAVKKSIKLCFFLAL